SRDTLHVGEILRFGACIAGEFVAKADDVERDLGMRGQQVLECPGGYLALDTHAPLLVETIRDGNDPASLILGARVLHGLGNRQIERRESPRLEAAESRKHLVSSLLVEKLAGKCQLHVRARMALSEWRTGCQRPLSLSV